MESKIRELKANLSGILDLQLALEIKKKWNKEHLDPIKELLDEATPEEKKDLGRRFNELKKMGDQIFHEFKETLLKNNLLNECNDSKFVSINTNLVAKSFNPLSEVRQILIELFHNLGFVIESGREVVSSEENFENLRVPLDHPSRSESETFYVSGDKKKILRPHCTVHSVNRLIEEGKTNAQIVKIATIGNVYRRDDETPRHTHQFSQLDFVWMQKGLNVCNLKYLMELISNSLFGEGKKHRFRNSYFPFTQPSFELDIACNCQHDQACSVCGGTGWIEIMGAGIFRTEILKNAGYSEEYVALAGGLGLERVALLKYEISDVRYLYSGNLDFLRDK